MLWQFNESPARRSFHPQLEEVLEIDRASGKIPETLPITMILSASSRISNGSTVWWYLFRASMLHCLIAAGPWMV